MYNLLYYQIVLQFCTRLSNEECEEVIQKFSDARLVPENGVHTLGAAMALVLNNLDRCVNFRQDPFENQFSRPYDEDDVEMSEDAEAGPSTKDSTVEKDMETKLKDFELELQSLCLPYLRNAALLRTHIYHQELPEVKGPEFEFARLVYFLELVTKSMDWKKFHAAKALCFATGTELSLPIHWCTVLKESRPPHDTTRELIVSQHAPWHQPQLLELPREYEKLFTVRFVVILMKLCLTLHFIAVLLRAGLPQVFIGPEGKFDLSDLRKDRLPQADVLQGTRLLRGCESKSMMNSKCHRSTPNESFF